MSGTNAGTGQPLYFRCWKQRQEIEGLARNPLHEVTLTGRTKAVRGGGLRMERFAREYQCSCGHVGWSRHKDLKRCEVKP